MSTKPYKHNVPNEHMQDWHDDPGKRRFSRIERIINHTNTRQLTQLLEVPLTPNIPEPMFSTIYGWKDKKWQVLGFKCLRCHKAMSKKEILEKHPLICTLPRKINNLDGENVDKMDMSIDQIEQQLKDNNMPIHKITQNGKVYYRYGDSGKMYTNREDAVKQAQAIHAAGYKEPPKQPTKKK